MAAKAQYIDGAWTVVIHHNRRRRHKRAHSKAAAELISAQINQRLSARALGIVVDPGETFQPYAERWLEQNEGSWKHSTHAFYADKLKNHIFPTMSSVLVTTITKTTCRELLAGLRRAGVGTAALTGVRATLSGVLSQAVDDELLGADPAFRLGKYTKSGDAVKKRIEPFTRDEVTRLLAAAEKVAPAWALFLLFAVRAGLRLGELLAVEWDDLDLVVGTARLRRSYTRGRLTSLKNKHERTVDLSPQLVEALQRERLAQRKAALASGSARSRFVFPGIDGDTVRDAWAFRKKEWKRIQRSAELRVRRLHDCRHTFAALLLSDGVPVIYVKEQMGHSSITVTVDTYGKFIPTTSRTHVARLDDADFRPADATAAPAAPAPAAAADGTPAAVAKKKRSA